MSWMLHDHDGNLLDAGLGDKPDLDLAIWACFANARITAGQAREDQHEHDLAA